MLSVGFLVFVVTFVYNSRATPLYTATASIMIDTQQERVVDTQAVLSGLSADSSTVDTQVEILKSRQLADRVVRELKLDQDPAFNWTLREPDTKTQIINGIKRIVRGAAPDAAQRKLTAVEQQMLHEQIVDGLLAGLSVRRAGMTYIMNVSYTSPDPAKASLIANTFADKYLLEQLEARFEATRAANQWLNTRLSSLRQEVLQAEAAVAQYRAANNLLSASGATLTEQEISTYNQQVATAQTEQAAAEARLRTALSQLAAGSTGDDVGEALGSTVVQQLRGQRAQVSGRVADLAGRYGPRHPEMLKAQRELQDIDAQIQAEIKRLISNLEAQARVARERTNSMRSSLGQARGSLASNNAATVRLNELNRNAEAVRTLYQSFLNRFQETTAQEGLTDSDARIVSRAKIPTYASSPNTRLNLALGLLLAIGAGVAAAIAAEVWDSGIATGEDVETRLGVDYLGHLPLLSSVAEPGERKDAPYEYLVEHPLSAFSESLRSLRTSITYSRPGQRVGIVTVTSALPGEGKTTTTTCIARSAAQSGGRVIVLDCDIRRRNVHNLIGADPQIGLIEVLNGDATLEQATVVDRETGAAFLPLGPASFTPRDVFGGPAMKKLLQDLAELYDLVLLDAPPALAVSDARVLAAQSDAVVFVIRWRKTPENAVQGSLKQLQAVNASLAGVVLTQVDMRKQSRYGYGDPGYYYGQYQKYYQSA